MKRIYATIDGNYNLHPLFEKYRGQEGIVVGLSKHKSKPWASGHVQLRFPDGKELTFEASLVNLIGATIIRYCDVERYHEYHNGGSHG